MGNELIEQADRLLDAADVSELSVSVRSLAATYSARRKDGEDRGTVAFARALIRAAEREGVGVAETAPKATVADLKAEIERRNEGRDDDALIRPDSQKKADLEAALAADDDQD